MNFFFFLIISKSGVYWTRDTFGGYIVQDLKFESNVD